jgi:putative glutamine amidotransferase
MMRKPLIGLTSQNENPLTLRDSPYVRDYIESIERAGGSVRLIPAGGFDESLENLFASLDGLLLSGGGDIDPVRFNGTLHPSIDGISFERDQMEFGLLEMAIWKGLPFLGICRGCQVVNVCLGGTLYTDIPDQLGTTIQHSISQDEPRDLIAHSVTVAPDSWLARLTGKSELQVNSRHHQGIDRLGNGLEVMAAAPDGLVEAICLEGHPFGMAVQWHPENMFGDPSAREIFQAFIAKCGEGK